MSQNNISKKKIRLVRARRGKSQVEAISRNPIQQQEAPVVQEEYRKFVETKIQIEDPT